MTPDCSNCRRRDAELVEKSTELSRARLEVVRLANGITDLMVRWDSMFPPGSNGSERSISVGDAICALSRILRGFHLDESMARLSEVQTTLGSLGRKKAR